MAMSKFGASLCRLDNIKLGVDWNGHSFQSVHFVVKMAQVCRFKLFTLSLITSPPLPSSADALTRFLPRCNDFSEFEFSPGQLENPSLQNSLCLA